MEGFAEKTSLARRNSFFRFRGCDPCDPGDFFSGAAAKSLVKKAAIP